MPIGIVPGWDEYWDRYFLYELRDVDSGVAASTDRGVLDQRDGRLRRRVHRAEPSRSVAPSGMPGGMPMVTFSSRRPRPLGRKSRAGRV